MIVLDSNFTDTFSVRASKHDHTTLTPAGVTMSFSGILSQVSGRSLVHLSQQDALRIIETSQRPITLQFKSQRGRRSSAGGGSWEPLPLNLHHLNLPLPLMGPELNTSSPSYQDRCVKELKNQTTASNFPTLTGRRLQEEAGTAA